MALSLTAMQSLALAHEKLCGQPWLYGLDNRPTAQVRPPSVLTVKATAWTVSAVLLRTPAPMHSRLEGQAMVSTSMAPGRA
jgi:hypothetical protein